MSGGWCSSPATRASARRRSSRASSRRPSDRAVIARGQCVEHRGAGEPYLPILEAFGRLCRQEDGEALVPLLARQAPMWLAQMPWLLEDDELEAVQRRIIGASPGRMLREMLETLEAISQATPLVLVLEDLHWSDPSTVDLLDGLARRSEQRDSSFSAPSGAPTPSRSSIPSTVSRDRCVAAACAPRSPSDRSTRTPSRTT